VVQKKAGIKVVYEVYLKAYAVFEHGKKLFLCHAGATAYLHKEAASTALIETLMSL
jgi:hypothetical protein